MHGQKNIKFMTDVNNKIIRNNRPVTKFATAKMNRMRNSMYVILRE